MRRAHSLHSSETRSRIRRMIQLRGQFISTVQANIPLCREHYRLVLSLPQFPPTEPGQFVQLSCREMAEGCGIEREAEWGEGRRFDSVERGLLSPQAYLRRPFSLAGRRDVSAGVELEFIHRVVGVGTVWLSRLRAGDRVHLLGPLGNRFSLPQEDELAILVGGGVGIPPMLYLAEALAGRPALAFAGAVSRDLLPLTIDVAATASGPDAIKPSLAVTEFARHGIPSVITTDDGSYGFRGFVTQALEAFLDSVSPRFRVSTRLSSSQAACARPILYTCGPEPMMKRVVEIAAERGIECQVAVERAMACGMGTCQSCCIRVRKPDPSKPPLAGSEWCWRLSCTDGPIFRGADLLW